MIDDTLTDFKISHWLIFIWVEFMLKICLYQNKTSQIYSSTVLQFSKFPLQIPVPKKSQSIPARPVHPSTAGHPDITHPPGQWFLPFSTDPYACNRQKTRDQYFQQYKRQSLKWLKLLFWLRIYTLKKKCEINWANYGRKYGNCNVRRHTPKAIHERMQQISKNSMTHIIKEKFSCALTRLWQMHTLRIENFNLTNFE